MAATGNEDIATSTQVINPTSNNPESFQQTSTLYTTSNDGLAEDEFCLSVNLTNSNVQEQVNIVVVIDTSGSSGGSSGTDFDGDGRDETILQAELIAAFNLFDEYVAAGYAPAKIDISLVLYSPTAEVRGNFTLDERDDFVQALQDIDDDGSNGTTNYVAGLEAVDDALSAVGADPVGDTNSCPTAFQCRLLRDRCLLVARQHQSKMPLRILRPIGMRPSMGLGWEPQVTLMP